MEFPGPQNVSQHLWPLGSGGGREVTIFHSDPLNQCPGVSASCVPRAPAGTGSPRQMQTVTVPVGRPGQGQRYRRVTASVLRRGLGQGALGQAVSGDPRLPVPA